MRDDRTTELLETLKGEVDKLTDSDQWKRWLATAARFHNYSFSNQLLIFLQRPDATRVAGYRKWQELKRQVRKGEKGIHILAPIIKKVKDADGNESPRCVGFRGTTVFDISQTDGEPLPAVEVPDPSLLIDSWDLYDRFAKVAADEGVTISKQSDSPSGAHGWYEPKRKHITIIDTYPVAAQTRTLLHELAHHFTPELTDKTRPQAELIAESAAFIVGSQLGVDTTGYSAFYTAGWANGNSDNIEAVAGVVLKTAKRMYQALGME